MKPLSLRAGKNRSTVSIDNSQLDEMLFAYKQVLAKQLEEAHKLNEAEGVLASNVVPVAYETCISRGNHYYSADQLQLKLNEVKNIIDQL